MNRSANIYVKNNYCGQLQETDEGYAFKYDEQYMQSTNAEAISATMPLQQEAYKSNTLFAFFDGLIPEGWLLDIAEKNWKINYKDRMGLLITCCKDCIGAISVRTKSEKL